MTSNTADRGDPRSPTTLTGGRATVDKVFMWGLMLFLVACLVQFFLAGLGVFDLQGHKIQNAGSLDPHRALGDALGVLSLVLLILALVAHVSSRTMLVSLLLAVLTAGAQSALAAAGETTAFWGGLHALDGLIILGVAGFLQGEARRRARATSNP
ncbi:MAG: DUF6220 domain-containing protein [Nocardioidaceae bacterium]